MSITDTIATVGVGAASGLAGLLVMDPVTTKIYEMTPHAVIEKEKAAQEDSAMKVAAEKSAEAVGVHLTDKQAEKGASLIHYGLGVFGGLVYALLRRNLSLHPALVGLLTGLGMFVFLDEGLNAAAGFSAPPSAYPKETHLRGLIGHLAFGLGVAAAAEAFDWVRENVG